MNKLNQSIDWLKVQGAVRATIKGEDCIVIRLAKSRAKPHSNGSVYWNFEAVERKEKDKFGNTHFVCEPTTKEEREQGIKLPILGNGKVYQPKGQQRSYNAPERAETAPEDDGGDIPF